MTDKNEIIKNGYIAYGFPGESRLYTLLSKDNKEITKDDIKTLNHIYVFFCCRSRNSI